MPVVTRSQIKNIVSEPEPASKCAVSFSITELKNRHTISEACFLKSVNTLLNISNESKDRYTKIWNINIVYDIINRHLEKFLYNNRLKWIEFAAIAYNKTTQYEIELGTWKNVNSELVDKFRKSYLNARKFLSEYFKNIKSLFPVNDLASTPYAELYENIELCDLNQRRNQRPRRNVPIVNYTGMDTIEPECEDDDITDIWFDETTEYDSDYNPEDDE
jgi:hypothetical protein